MNEQISVWWLLCIIFIAGALGGIVNALITDNGFILPLETKSCDVKIIRPGFLGNVIIGGIAACISWGLYGPFANIYLVGGLQTNAQQYGITLAGFVGAILVGVGGARWLTNEVDKNLLRAAATKAAGSSKNDELVRKLAIASPAEALRAASIHQENG